MKFKTINKEDIETMSFDDLAYLILKENEEKMKITDIFKIICDELNLGKQAYENQIADFFALLSTEKRFIQLSEGYWDLRENHTSEIRIKELEDELEDDITIEENIEETEDEYNYYDELNDSEDEETEDDLKDLVVVDESYDEEDSDL